MDTFLIYTPQLTNRIDFIFTHIFFRVLKLEFGITVDINEYNAHEGPKMSYTEQGIADTFRVKPYGLLHEQGLKEHTITVSDYEGLKVFFLTDENADLPFDIFSASFFLLTRYEEYLTAPGDKYDRFEAIQSLAYLHGFLLEPLVDKWIMLLKSKLQFRFPGLEFPVTQYSFISSIDIDNPFAFRHKGLVRTVGALLKALLRGDLNSFFGRFSALGGSAKDPFDTYDYIDSVEHKYKTKSLYFFLVGDYGRHDTSVPFRKLAYQNLIKKINAGHQTGLHPSFNSNKSFELLEKEWKRLTKVTGQKVQRSRQHYLQLKMPETYRNLIRLGIREDYSMGYASALGFRASTSMPFRFFDLGDDIETNLTVFPFEVMDVTLHNYLRVRATQAMSHISKIIDGIKAVDGLFISLWHNESLSEQGMWIGWRKVFEDMFEYASVQELPAVELPEPQKTEITEEISVQNKKEQH
ncbi:MAG: polysaccharide deacetylase family protein [Bacteroidales bacterium]|nr:polysaccharide deacetylase family protein [Bacteroidales bacterium]